MTDRLNILVAIVTRNRICDLKECLKSLRLTNPNPSGILVVDNGSTDGTIATMKQEFPEVDVIANSINRGCAGGRNQGLEYGIGRGYDYVQFLDDDMVVGQDFIGKILDGFKCDIKVGISVATLCYYDTPSIVYSGGGIFKFKEGFLTTHKMDNVKVVKHLPCEYSQWAFGGASCIATRILNDVGYLDENMGAIGGEDYDYSLRVRKAGYSICWVPSAIIYHKGFQTPGMADTTSNEKIYAGYRNLARVYRNNYGLAKYLIAIYYISKRMIWLYEEYINAGDGARAGMVCRAMFDNIFCRRRIVPKSCSKYLCNIIDLYLMFRKRINVHRQ